MDILLSHGYFIAEDPHEQQIMKPYPPLGLLYISSHLKRCDFEVTLFDSTFETLAAYSAALEQLRPPIVGLYCNLMTRRNVLQMIAATRRFGARIVLGGPEPVNYAVEYLQAGADIIVVGEGELTLQQLIPKLQQDQPLDDVAGIIFQNADGTLTQTPARPLIADLSGQPWPDREAIDFERYLQTWQTHHGVRSISLVTARGCPYTCRWCSHSVFGHTHRRRRPEEVVDEVAYLVERYQPDQLWYADDVLTIAPRWFKRYAAALHERGLRVPFECISRADRLDEETIALLVEMGCSRLWIGSESGSQRVLDGMARRANVEDIQHKTQLLQAGGIEVGMFIMFGYEGEEAADIAATADHLKQANPDRFLTTVAYPIKGTSYYEEVQQRIGSTIAWHEGSDRDLTIAGRHSKRYYEHATRWVVSSVDLHKARRQGERNPLRLGKLLLNVQRGRLGMLLSQHEREQLPAGSGWTASDRAGVGW